VIREFLHLFAPLTANCSHFTRRWEAAATPHADSVGGRWEGEWISEASGHRGPLRAVLTVGAPTLWHVSFRAGYASVLRACYATDFTVAVQDGRWTFTGASDLGTLAGGRYQYAGSATLTELICTYRSSAVMGSLGSGGLKRGGRDNFKLQLQKTP
jgi:hypothetical protein